jgi:hypothetical protein
MSSVEKEKQYGHAVQPVDEIKFAELLKRLKENTFDSSPPSLTEERAGIIDWSASICDANTAVRELQETLVLKNASRSRAALDKLIEAAENLNLFLKARGV